MTTGRCRIRKWTCRLKIGHIVSGRRSPCSSSGWSADTQSRARLCSVHPRSVNSRPSSSPKVCGYQLYYPPTNSLLLKRNFPTRQVQGANRRERQGRRSAADDRGNGRPASRSRRRAHRSRAELSRGQARHHQRCRARHVARSSQGGLRGSQGRLEERQGCQERRQELLFLLQSVHCVSSRGGADGGLFEVYEAPLDEGHDVLAHMLGEEVAI